MSKAFLKWPGGKYKLISKIVDCLPSGERFYDHLNTDKETPQSF